MVGGVPMIPGKRTALRANGYAAGICPACRQVGVLQILTVASQRTKNLMVTSDTVVGFAAKCGACGMRRRAGYGTFSQFLPDASMGLTEMLEQTNPGSARAIAELNRENAKLLDGTAGEDDRIAAAAYVIEAVLADADLEFGSIVVDGWTVATILAAVFAAVWVLVASNAPRSTVGFMDWAMLTMGVGLAVWTSLRANRRNFGRRYTTRLAKLLLGWRFTPAEVEEALNRLARGLTAPTGWVNRGRLIAAMAEEKAPR